jgi:hypothetical protein
MELQLIEWLRAINAAALAGPAATSTTSSTSTTQTTVLPPPLTTTTTSDDTTSSPSGGVDRVIQPGEHFPNGFTVPAGETWAFAPAAQVTTAGNVVVEGILRMHQPDPSAQQRLTFVDVDPSKFKGGDTHSVLESDTGLWLVNNGALDAQGAPKTGWTHLQGAVRSGARSIDVVDATGWRVGDEIVITPTLPVSSSGHWTASDRRVVTSVDGNKVGVDEPLRHDHPKVADRWTAEVINLSRSVLIEGTPGREAHIISLHQGMHASGPVGHRIRFVQLRHLGPAKKESRGLVGVTGRYPLHFHHSGTSSDGVLIEGVSAHDCNNHCFVSHRATGITWRDCATHATLATPYWWDPGQSSERIVYDRCIASEAKPDNVSEKYSLTGFSAAQTDDAFTSVMRGCVASGIAGNWHGSGFFWGNNNVGVWTFEDCLAHNSDMAGIRVWQNSGEHHLIDRFVAYNCQQFGITHGAYNNTYQYHGASLHGCGTGIRVSATSATDGPHRQEWHDIVVTECATHMELIDAAVNSSAPTDFRRLAGVDTVLVKSSHKERHHWDFTDCGLQPDAFRVESRAGDFRIRTQDGGAAWQLGPNGDWVSIPGF